MPDPQSTGAYNGGIQLTTLDGRPSAGLDVRGANGIVHLTATVNAQRGCTSTSVELFSPDEIDDVILALRAAKERAWADLHKTGAPA